MGSIAARTAATAVPNPPGAVTQVITAAVMLWMGRAMRTAVSTRDHDLQRSLLGTFATDANTHHHRRSNHTRQRRRPPRPIVPRRNRRYGTHGADSSTIRTSPRLCSQRVPHRSVHRTITRGSVN
jgi:hypothetical protein